MLLTIFAKEWTLQTGVKPMATMNISLPDAMKDWVEAQTQSGSYSNTSDFVRDLIRRDQTRRTQISMMQDWVDEARSSGISGMTMPDIREAMRDRLAGADCANDV
jgi:antitoxin ParD1/3/4